MIGLKGREVGVAKLEPVLVEHDMGLSKLKAMLAARMEEATESDI